MSPRNPRHPGNLMAWAALVVFVGAFVVSFIWEEAWTWVSWVAVLTGTYLVGWSDWASRCDDCGTKLAWVDPEWAGGRLPLTRCPECDGPHVAYPETLETR